MNTTINDVRETPAFPRLEATRYGFYVWMAGLFLLIAFGSFIPTYWAKLANGTFDRPPIFHIHGVLLFGWTAFFFMQTALIATGRRLDHRTWGLAGISLFSLMMCSIAVLGIMAMRSADAAGMGDVGRRFAFVTFSGWLLLAVFFALAIAKVHRPESHKRLMFLAMVVLVRPAIARVFAALLAPPGAVGPPPLVSTVGPGLVGDLLLLAAVIHDWRTIGRLHPVYLYGGLAILLVQGPLLVLVANSAAWMSFATYLQRLAG
jgi:hypothetical protein